MRGSVIATIILYALPEIFRSVGDYRMLIYAIVLIAMMIFKNAPYFKGYKDKIKAMLIKKTNPAGGGSK